MARLFSLLMVAMLMCSTAYAQKNDANAPEFEETPITQWIDAENKLLDTLPEANQRVFFVMRNKHSVIRSVKVVDRDIGNAVQECGKENPDYKDTIFERYGDWQNAVHPILKTAEDFLDQELKQQKAFHVGDYRHVMAKNDKAFQFSERQVMKKPVSTLKACQRLVKSMDRTEDDLVTLLQEILLPEEVIRKRAERQETKS